MNDLRLFWVRQLVFGPIIKSLSFWLEIMFLILAGLEFSQIWRQVDRFPILTGPIRNVLFLIFGILVFACYLYFCSLARIRKQAQTETDEEKRRLLCESANDTYRMFCFGVGGLAVGLMVCSMVLVRVLTLK